MTAEFRWGLKGLNEARFKAYSNLLRLRVEAQDETKDGPAHDDFDDEANAAAQEVLFKDEIRLKIAF